ncbi:flagella basal body P-ring formation protein FlgA [Parasphingorhabdus cellanae]|uniref:Flagella basal body P-ring formation protein FlgA n=1 Tax=Parasphingorhabdus cellanae TaxID=2806553 RepID=A0ABX7T1K1_9SPHN|nr:flagella basal body P-ring formation protein FlgA [Parasphingorhabdus cellanae]QTD55444.1 flagella basal body P-ring formation protein FlgA [Parasphingorhabdus cellanae]
MPHYRSSYRIAIPLLSVLTLAATSPFEDTAKLDQQVATYLNASIGDVGGARAPIDAKLKLKRCAGPVQFSNTNRNAVLVSCADWGWRIFVPVQGGQSRQLDRAAAKDEFVVFRNQPLTLVVKRPSFSISYNVVAQKNGRIGDYIPVRASRKSKMLMARVSGSGSVELAQ